MAEGVQARLVVGAVRGQHAEDDARRAKHDRERAGHIDADTERARGLVARAGVLGRLVDAAATTRAECRACRAPRRSSGGSRRRRGAFPKRPRRRSRARPRGEGGRSPSAAGCARIRSYASGSWVRSQSSFGAVKPVSAGLPSADQPLEPDTLLDLGALRRGALVVPGIAGRNTRSLRVERDESVHLTREADRPGREPLRAPPASRATSRRGPVPTTRAGGVESG